MLHCYSISLFCIKSTKAEWGVVVLSPSKLLAEAATVHKWCHGENTSRLTGTMARRFDDLWSVKSTSMLYATVDANAVEVPASHASSGSAMLTSNLKLHTGATLWQHCFVQCKKKTLWGRVFILAVFCNLHVCMCLRCNWRTEVCVCVCVCVCVRSTTKMRDKQQGQVLYDWV